MTMIRYEVRRRSDGAPVFEAASHFDCERFIEEGRFRDAFTTADDCEVVEIAELGDDTIGLYWSVEDVRKAAPYLTDDECRRVLRLAEKEHDASIGLSWDVLDYFVDFVLKEG